MPGAFHVSPGWFASWDAAYLGSARALAIGGLALLDEVATLGPLRYRRRRSRTNLHTPAYDIDPSVPPVANLPAALLAGADVVSIAYLPESSPLLAAARTWRGVAVRIAPHAMAPAADCRDSYAAWFERRSKRIRSRWPKLEATVTDKLGMRCEFLDRFDDLPGLLAQLFAVERSGWKGRNGTAITDSPADTLFYTALATRAAAAGVLRVALLRQGDRVTAFEYGVIGGNRLFLLKVGYDETYGEASLGHVLAARHIRHCCEDPQIDWYDKLGNGMTPAPYKLRFADRSEPLLLLTLYAPTWRGRIVRYADAARDAAKRLRDRWRRRAA